MLNILEADSINLSFDGRKILSDIYLKCETGEVVGLIGRNGVGKSSLMKIIFGSVKGENQSVRVNRVFSSCFLKEKNVINYLPQDHFLMDYLTLNEVITLFDLSAEVLSIPELKEVANFKMGTLSGGQKRLIEITAILFSPTKFSLLDEPFSFLSPKLVEILIPLIQKQSLTKGVIISDHQYRSVLRSCNKYYLMLNESIREIESASDLEQFGYLTPKQAAIVDKER